jgi:hypothetical protein
MNRKNNDIIFKVQKLTPKEKGDFINETSHKYLQKT